MVTSSKLSIAQAAANLLRKKRERTYVASICGHTTRLAVTLHAFDDHAVVDLPQNERQLPMYCATCIAKLSILCAWCSRTIFVGDPITLHKTYTDFLVPLDSRVYSYAPFRLVGCMHTDCADVTDPVSGFWRVAGDGECFVGEMTESREVFLFRHNLRRRPTYHAPVKKRRR